MEEKRPDQRSPASTCHKARPGRDTLEKEQGSSKHQKTHTQALASMQRKEAEKSQKERLHLLNSEERWVQHSLLAARFTGTDCTREKNSQKGNAVWN